jgi:hypothetical protein
MIRVSRALYRNALADAIDWEESFCASHDPDINGAVAHCKPGARCDAYKTAARLLASYRRAYAAAGGRPGVLESALAEARSVPIQDLPMNDHFVLPDDSPR